MKPLSIIKFLRGSYRKILPLIITVSLSVALLYFFSIIINHIINQNIELNVAPLKNMSILAGTGEKYTDEELSRDINTLNSSAAIKHWYLTNLRNVNLKTNTSNNDIYLLMLAGKNINPIMKLQKSVLTHGSLPKLSNEVILHKKLAANYNLQVGSVIKKGTPGWNNDNDIKLVGIFDGPAILGFGYMDESLLNSGKYNISVITVTDDSKADAMDSFLVNNFGSKYQIITYNMLLKAINDKNKNINSINTFVGIIVILVLSVILGNICMIQYTQRNKEFELLHAMGYTRWNIAVKTFKEIGVSALIGYLTGILLAILGAWLLNVCVLSEKAFGMSLILINNMLWVLLAPLLVIVTGMITPLKLLRFREIS